jgi:3-phosphoshikimate 1-carboxyvinyltransferase
MPLPELIEIVPLDKPVQAEITVPGSKSITNRALILAALADGEVTLSGALWSEDTQVMTEALKTLGFEIRVENDPAEFCNRTITVKGLGGKIPRAGTADQPLELFVGNAGTAARFLAAFVCLGDGVYRLSGVPRMHERPQAALFQALRELGYRVEAGKGSDKLPVRIFGSPNRRRGDESQTKNGSQSLLTSSPTKKSCRVSIEDSSQFASALLLSAKHGDWQIEITGENADESPYVVMTSKLMEVFPWCGGDFQIEPDASSGSYFWAAGIPEPIGEREKEYQETPDGDLGFTVSVKTKWSVTVHNWPYLSGWQIDAQFPEHIGLVTRFDLSTPEEMAEVEQSLAKMWGPNWRERQKREYSKYLEEHEVEHGPTTVSRQTSLGDSIMTLIVLAPYANQKIVFTDLGRLRVQECERVVALRTELTRCGAKVVEQGDTLTVYPSKPEELHGAEIETYNDHRMAMCFAVLGLKVPGIRIKNPACVKKTFPNFFQKLAAAPPYGLGVTIWEIKNGQRTRQLSGEDLFAD